ncbi:MAG TPA: hypothetical protein VLE43_03450 [Candidatus Saccharimonadia bacterium]|nr:hypothetical protein [Candidatus Saccharimonadia bacterium]
MSPSNARILMLAGLAVVLLLIVSLGAVWLLWGGLPNFEVKGFWWN